MNPGVLYTNNGTKNTPAVLGTLTVDPKYLSFADGFFVFPTQTLIRATPDTSGEGQTTAFEEGQSLKSWLKGLGRAPRQKEIDRFLAPLLDALELIHKEDFLHRDIAPDNIIIRPDGAPVLIDFGSARGEIARNSRTVSACRGPRIVTTTS